MTSDLKKTTDDTKPISVLIMGRHDNPYTMELITELLRDKNYKINLLDIHNMIFSDFVTGNITYLIKERHPLRKIGVIFIPLRIYLVASFLKRLHIKYDIVNIQYFKYDYVFIYRRICNAGKKIIISIWGSDYLRSRLRKLQELLYKRATYITFETPEVAAHFLAHYNQKYFDKIRYANFGSYIFNTLDDLTCSTTKDVAKTEFGLATDRFIIVIGSNATSAQQHEKIIEILSQLPKEVSDRVALVFPLTYPQDENYRNKIQRFVHKKLADFQLLLITKYMTNEEVAKLRMITDILIFVPRTDTFSGAMLQSLYSGSLLITGNWLPYSFLDTKEVFFQKIENLDEINEIVSSYVKFPEKFKKLAANNRSIIENLMKWDLRIKDWIRIYND